MAKSSATLRPDGLQRQQSKTSFHVCTCALNWRNLRRPINFDPVPECRDRVHDNFVARNNQRYQQYGTSSDIDEKLQFLFFLALCKIQRSL